MPRLHRTARAEQDLIEIWLYIATENPNAADKLLDQLDTVCTRLAANPLSGPARPDFAPDLRYSLAGSYLVLYRQIADGIEIVRVLHGARHIPDLL